MSSENASQALQAVASARDFISQGATASSPGASVECMHMDSHREKRATRARSLLLVAAVMAAGISCPARAQNAAQTPAVGTSLSEIYQPALDQVGTALRQIDVSRWKLSRQWKAQIASDASSIQQDLSAQLPTLLQQAQASPAMIGPQLNLLRNVDALYDVMVRVTTAANISGGRADAAVLTSALQRLEQARKSAGDSLLQSAAAQDQQVIQLRSVIQAAARAEHKSIQHPTTIVVNNGETHRTKRRKKVSHLKPASKPSASTSATSTGTKTNPER
jgi:hypothetical protein